MENNKPILEVKNLKKYFIKRKGLLGRKFQYIQAVDDISFEVFKGETFGIVGESGCGKTTAGRSIIKLYDITDGQVYYKDEIVSSGTLRYIEQIKSLKEKAKIDCIKENPFLFKQYTIKKEAKDTHSHINKQTDEINQLTRDALDQLYKPINDFKKLEINSLLETKLEIDDYTSIYQQKIYHAENSNKGILKHEASNEIANFRYTAKRDLEQLHDQFIHAKSEAQLKKEKIRKDLKAKILLIRLESKKIAKNTFKEQPEKTDVNNEKNIDVTKGAFLAELKHEEMNKIALLRNKATTELKASKFNSSRKKAMRSEIRSKKIKIKKELKANIAAVNVDTKKKIAEDRLSLPSKKYVIKLKKEAELAIGKKTNTLKRELESKLADAKKALPELPVLEKQKEDILTHQADVLAKLDKKRMEIGPKTKKQLAELVADKKANPTSYKTDKKKIMAIKKQTRKEIYDQKKLIHHAHHDDRIKSKFRKSMQMIFQDPYASLNSRMTVSDIISEPIKIHHLMPQHLIKNRVNELLEMVGLSREHASRYPHEFSGGQRQRIGVARALAVNPDFIICDEPISALDVSIQAQVINLLEELQDKLGLTYIFIAHDLSMVKHISDRIAVMYLGKIVEVTTSGELFKNPLHPYTKALLSAVPVPSTNKSSKMEQIILEGDLPSPINPPSGCRFRTRCQHVHSRCTTEEPQLQDMGNKHVVSCHLFN